MGYPSLSSAKTQNRMLVIGMIAIFVWFTFMWDERKRMHDEYNQIISSKDTKISELNDLVNSLKENLEIQTVKPPIQSIPPPKCVNDLHHTLVFSRFHEDVSWIPIYLSNHSFVVYNRDVEGADFNLLPGDKGNEAAVFYDWIIRNYDNLPQHVMFLHAARESWHVTPSVSRVEVIRKFRWGQQPYTSLTEGVGNAMPHTSPEYRNVKSLWPTLFEAELGYPMPVEVRAPCCAEFAVTREAILARKKEFYQNQLKWLFETEMSTYYSGRVMEHTWHMVFGMPPDMTNAMATLCTNIMYCE